MRPYGNRWITERLICPATHPMPTRRGVPPYALRQGLTEISRIGGRIAMRPYGNRWITERLICPATHPMPTRRGVLPYALRQG